MKISLFIPSYNQRDYLREAIDSALAQTLTPCQIIVVDDGSSDGSQDLIADYARRHTSLFTPIFHKRNTGVSQVRIDALQAVRGDFVSYLDGDDRYLPEKLEMEAAALAQHPSAKIAFSNNVYVSEDGRTPIRRWIDDEAPPEGNVFAETFARDFPKRSLFRMELVAYEPWKRIGFHDPNLKLYEDFDMRIRLTKHLEVVYCDEVLTEIRTHGGGLSKSRPGLHFEALDYVFRKNLPLLADLDEDRRRHVIRRFGSWVHPVGCGAAREAMHQVRPLQAARLWSRARTYRQGSAA